MMKKTLCFFVWAVWGTIALALAPWSCGADKAPIGEFCEKDEDCQSGFCNINNVCSKPGSDVCEPPCERFESCVNGTCMPINASSDQDGDGWSNSTDCDDLDAFTYPADPERGIPGGFESCDGKDNDCDGVADEGCRPCLNGQTQPCGTDLGECTTGAQSCQDGRWESCDGTPPELEACDSLDNDCDGLTDEVCPCRDGKQFTCGVEEGICTQGLQTCESGTWSECLQAQMPVAEVCDDLDNDCDSLVDDGFMIGLDCDGIGECGTGTYQCASARQARCSTEPAGSENQSQPERCNGLDDDCDGPVDEDFNAGQPCLGTGMCGNGVLECVTEDTANCSTNPGGSDDQSRPEICDDLDNDCDSETDEDFGWHLPCDGQGECGEGIIECVTQSTTRCSTEPGGSADQSRPEVCDGRDNDCDGETDEGSDQELCSPYSAHVVRGTCNRGAGACQVANPGTDCEIGWWDLDRDWGNGCEFGDDGPNDRCADAIALDTVSDCCPGARQEVTATGQLIPAGDEDWYRISALDTFNEDEGADLADNYNVVISFTSQPEGVVFDVATDSCAVLNCTKVGGPSDPPPKTFTFYTNFYSGGIGQNPCRLTNTQGFNICSQKDHTFFIRVYRLASYPVNEQPYTIRITNGL